MAELYPVPKVPGLSYVGHIQPRKQMPELSVSTRN